MKILIGLNDHAVIQRMGEKSCHCEIIGESPIQAPIDIAVFGAQRIETARLESLRYEPLDNGNTLFKCTLTGIPMGGPYTIELKQHTKVQFTDILVGDLYVLAGQSNMEGIGKLDDKIPSHPFTRAFYMDDYWGDALDPIHDLTTAADAVHRHINGAAFEPRSQTTGTGLGVSFGQAISRTMGVPVGLIACAHGGTNMDQWSPHYPSNEGYGLYHMMINRIKKAGGKVNGLLWYQGCSDTYKEASEAYLEKMSLWIKTVRAAVYAHLPIVLVQIARTCSHDPDAQYWNAVQKDQLKLGELFSNVQVVSAIDLQMDDFIHISGKSQQRLGKRCADAMHFLLNGSSMPTPRYKSLTLERDGESWNINIQLTFDFVYGQLISSGNPNGFVLTDAFTGEVKNYIYHTELSGDTILLKTTESLLDLSNCLLSYGHGFMPYCNITDEADRALPAFHMIKLGEPRVLSSPCTVAWVGSKKEVPKGSTGIVSALSHDMFKDFWYYFLNSHSYQADALMYHMPFELSVNEGDRTTCDLLIGGCGDFEVFVDGQLFYATTLTKPIAPDQCAITLSLSKDKHLLSVWYRSTDAPKGIFVRFAMHQAHSKILWLTPDTLTK